MPHEVTSWLSGVQGMCLLHCRLVLIHPRGLRERIMYWKTTSDGKESPGCILAVFGGNWRGEVEAGYLYRWVR